MLIRYTLAHARNVARFIRSVLVPAIGNLLWVVDITAKLMVASCDGISFFDPCSVSRVYFWLSLMVVPTLLLLEVTALANPTLLLESKGRMETLPFEFFRAKTRLFLDLSHPSLSAVLTGQFYHLIFLTKAIILYQVCLPATLM